MSLRWRNVAGGSADWPIFGLTGFAKTPAPFQDTTIVPPRTTIAEVWPHGTPIVDQLTDGTEHWMVRQWGADMGIITRHGCGKKKWGLRVTCGVDFLASASITKTLLETEIDDDTADNPVLNPGSALTYTVSGALSPGWNLSNPESAPWLTPLDRDPVTATLEWNMSLSIGRYLYYLPDGRVFGPALVQVDAKFYDLTDGIEFPYEITTWDPETEEGSGLSMAATTNWRTTTTTTNPVPQGAVQIAESDGGSAYASGTFGRGQALSIGHGCEMTLNVELWPITFFTGRP